MMSAFLRQFSGAALYAAKVAARRPLSLRLAMAAAGKIIDNRALRAVVAGAGFGQRQQVLRGQHVVEPVVLLGERIYQRTRKLRRTITTSERRSA